MAETNNESEVLDICNQILQLYKDTLKNNGNTASNQLSDTAKFITKWQGDYFEVYFELQDYWKYAEAGTKPHFPPVDKIEEWVRVKRVVPYSYNGKVPTTKQLAFLISRGISEKGTKAYFTLRNSLTEAENLINELAYILTQKFDKEIENDINEL